MAVSVETLSNLKRKITVSVPTEQIEEEIGSRLKDLAGRVKVDGFRHGKAPIHIVKQRYADTVRGDVLRDMVQSTLFSALKEAELKPAGSPMVEPGRIEKDKDFEYSATFEVFPEFEIKELDQDPLALVECVISDADVDKLIDDLRAQHKNWHDVERPAQLGDKVELSFEGFLDGQPFEGGRAEGYQLELGSGSMIPGFEDALIGGERGKPFEFNVTFPEDYSKAELAGKETTFKVTLTRILEGALPELDDEFAAQFIEGNVEAFKADVKANMTRELERRVSKINRDRTFDRLLEKNVFDLPEVMIDREIENLKHEMYHRIFGHHHSDNEVIPDFPRELFEEQAKRRVHLGLLFSDYMVKHKIAADQARIDALIEKFAEAYDDPDALRHWYREDKQRLAEIEGLVLEEMVAEKIAESAKVTHEQKTYDEIVHSKNVEGN